MFGIIWFILISVLASLSLVWVLDHDGVVLITWLGYEVKTDIVIALFLSLALAFVLFLIFYVFALILSIKFPNFLKTFFRKNYFKRLERLVHRHHQAFDVLQKLLLALEVEDEKSAYDLQKKFKSLVKNPHLNNFFLGKIAFVKKDFSESVDFFSKLGEGRNAKILVLRAKFKLALEKQENESAIAYARQILLVKSDSFDIVHTLFLLYKKEGLWQESKNLIAQYGADKFKDELHKRDVAVINSALALEAYQKRKISESLKYCKIALKAQEEFLPALEIMLKCLIRRGLSLQVNWMIKRIWRKNPHLILAKIFDFNNRKSSKKRRIKLIKALAKSNLESAVSKVAVGMVAYRVGDYEVAKSFLNESLLITKTYRAYRILAEISKSLGNNEESLRNVTRAKMFGCDDHYVCNACNHISAKWSAKCDSCGAYDSYEWNN